MEIGLNPFNVGNSIPEQLFCDRKEEFDSIINAIKANRSILIKGIRRVGKTALIHKVKDHFSSQKGISIFYTDLYPTDNLANFITTFAKSTLGKIDSNHLKLMRDLSNYFTHLRPYIEYDAVSGTPIIEFKLDDNYKAATTIEQLFSYLNRQPGKCILILDEIQQTISYKENLTIELLAKNLQLSKNIQVITIASSSPNLNKLLTGSQKMFFETMHQVELFCIDHDVYLKHISQLFMDAKRKVSDSVIDQILNWSRDQTYYVQQVCSRLYQSGIKQPDEWMIERLFIQILNENEAVYFSYRNLLTFNQWELLKAIAKERGARQILGNDFLRKYNLGSTSSIQTAMYALLEKEMIIDEEGRFYVVDVFLSRWLESK